MSDDRGEWESRTGFIMAAAGSAEISAGAGHVPAWAPAWQVICRYIAPVVIAWILVSGL